MQTDTSSTHSSSIRTAQQEPFARVAVILKAALLLGSGAGFVLATVLTLTLMLNVPLGPWWTALAQAHGHVQLYGWAGLFVLGVALHFMPRLRGTPLVGAWLMPWILGALVAGLVLRVLSQPLLAVTGAHLWAGLLIVSGLLECFALPGAVTLLALTFLRGPRLATRPAFRGIFPFIGAAFLLLGTASCVNLANTFFAVNSAGLVPSTSDDLNITLGLLGFLVPIALSMSAQSLPMYAGLEAFPRRILWPLAGFYMLGTMLTMIGIASGSTYGSWSGIIEGVGLALLGLALLIFISVFLRMMRTRGRLPSKVAQLAPSAETAQRTYQKHISRARSAYGPFVALVASAYIWAMLGGILLLSDGVTMILGMAPFFAPDAIRHSLAVGFITLLICGIAPRMVPGFSGGKITSPHLVSATLWLGNSAALLRVGAILLAPVLTWSIAGTSLYALLFGLSGPLGLALALCLTINLWPALRTTGS